MNALVGRSFLLWGVIVSAWCGCSTDRASENDVDVAMHGDARDIADGMASSDATSPTDTADARDGDGATEDARACWADLPSVDDPTHRVVNVRLEALEPGRQIDSVRLVDNGMEHCEFFADNIYTHSTLDFTVGTDAEEAFFVLGEPDGVADDGESCNEELATALRAPGDAMVVRMVAPITAGDVIEVRDAAACDEAEPGRIRVSITARREYWEPHLVVGEVSGPIGRITVPEDIFD